MSDGGEIKRVAVTGICGEWGKCLADSLKKKNPFECVLGVDVKEPSFSFRGFEFEKLPLHDKKKLLSALKKRRIQAIVHLAFFLKPETTISEALPLNLEAAKNAAVCARELGVKKFIFGSSTTVYGAFYRRRESLREDAPVTLDRNYSFSFIKAKMEETVQNVLNGSKVNCVILRRAQLLSKYTPVILPFAGNGQPFSPVFLGSDAPLQFIHAEDLSAITRLAIQKKMEGIYNVAADGTVRLSKLVRALGKVPVPVFPFAAKFGLSLLSLAGLSGEIAGSVDYFTRPPKCSNEKLKKELHYAFQYNAEEALADALKNRGQGAGGRRQ